MNSPERANGDTICLDREGDPLVVSGRVTRVHGKLLAGALVDIWQTNNDRC